MIPRITITMRISTSVKPTGPVEAAVLRRGVELPV
jgi:hypothetical protein